MDIVDEHVSDEIVEDDSDDSNSADDSKIDRYYQSNPKIPIFRTGKYSTTYSMFFDILVDSPNMKMVCTELPSLVEQNQTFVASVNESDVPISDISCDGHSGWVNDGVRRFMFVKKQNGYSLVSKKKLPANELKTKHFVLVRKYFHHKQHPDFKKVIAFIMNSRDQVCNNLVYLQYFFTGGAHSIERHRHGNAKRPIPNYCKTKPSIKNRARKNPSASAEKSVASNINSIGGVENISNPADIITSKQLRNLKYNLSNPRPNHQHCGEDEISELIQMGQNDFKHIIREIKQFPEPFVVLATDQQLCDLERFCCDDTEFAPMTVDPTFKLGKFNVTPISYRNLTLSTHHEKSQNPIAMGPMLIHFSKTEQVYSSFFQTLLRLRPGLSSLKAYGTDGETPLCKALATNFPQAMPL